MKEVLIISSGIFHPPLVGRWILNRFLEGINGYAFRHLRTLEQLPQDLPDYAAMVLYLHQKKISATALEKFDAYLSGGGGVLAIHAATACFKDTPRFSEILGGRFVGHGPVGAFCVTPVVAPDPVFGDLPAFQVVDELYRHELQPDIQVYFTAEEQGVKVPVVWTRTHGEGRVCYACPGHRAESLRLEEYQQLLLRGLEWVSGGGWFAGSS